MPHLSGAPECWGVVNMKELVYDIPTDVVISMTNEPSTPHWRMYRNAAIMATSLARPVVIIDCFTDRIAVAFSDMPLGLDCAMAHVKSVADSVDALHATDHLMVKARHVILELPMWQQTRACQLPPDSLLALLFYGALTTCAFVYRLVRRRQTPPSAPRERQRP